MNPAPCERISLMHHAITLTDKRHTNKLKPNYFINVYWNYSWKQKETMFEKIYIYR